MFRQLEARDAGEMLEVERQQFSAIFQRRGRNLKISEPNCLKLQIRGELRNADCVISGKGRNTQSSQEQHGPHSLCRPVGLPGKSAEEQLLPNGRWKCRRFLSSSFESG